jgi:outer membrane protein TolC
MAGMNPGYKTLRLFAALALALTLVQTALQAHAGALADVLEQAWSLHPQAGALEARAAEAQARTEIAGGLTPGPAALSLGHLNDNLGSGRGKQEWEVELAAPLWLPGQKAGHAAEATGILDEISARRAALRLELAGELRTAWWALAAARQANDLAQRRLSGARVLEADVLRRYRAGDLARVDANQARGETLAAQAESLQAETAMQQAERVWRGLTGLPAPAHLEAEVLPVRDAASKTHPRLIALSSASRVANARLKLAQTTRRDAPELAVRVLRERGDSSEAFGNAIGIKLSIPFSSGPRLRRDNAAARAEAMQAEAEQLQVARQLALDLEQARHDIAAAEQLAAMARERREVTADTLRLAEKTFSLGESDLTALLRARAAAFEAEAVSIRQETAHGSAVSQLKQALGEMP